MALTRETHFTADCPATAIPSGESAVLPSGASAYVMQTLGGSVTVRTDRGLFRIARADIGSLAGLTAADLPPEQVVEGEFGEELVWSALKTCFDPEIPVNIVDLGLIYDCAITPLENGRHLVEVKMTLTAQGCGMGPVIAEDARAKITALPTVEAAKVHIVWDPVWTPHMISPAGRKQLGLDE